MPRVNVKVGVVGKVHHIVGRNNRRAADIAGTHDNVADRRFAIPYFRRILADIGNRNLVAIRNIALHKGLVGRRELDESIKIDAIADGSGSPTRLHIALEQIRCGSLDIEILAADLASKFCGRRLGTFRVVSLNGVFLFYVCRQCDPSGGKTRFARDLASIVVCRAEQLARHVR